MHLYGHPVDMDPILELSKKYNLYVVEDAAEAHGAKYKGRTRWLDRDLRDLQFLRKQNSGDG